MANGSVKPIRDVKLGDKVLAYDKAKNALVESFVVDTYRGRDQVKMYQTKFGGNEIGLTPDHEILTMSGKGIIKLKQAQDLANSFEQAILPVKWEPKIIEPGFDVDVAKFLGLLVGDGHLCARDDRFKLTNTSLEICEFAKKTAETLIGCKATIKQSNRGRYYDVFFTKTHQSNEKSPLYYLLAACNLYGKVSGNKEVPDCILKAPTKYVQAFLQGLYAADGTARKNRVDLSTTSPELARTVRLCLLRLGSHSTQYVRKRKNPNHADEIVVSVCGYDSVKVFGDIPTKPLILEKPSRQRNALYNLNKIVEVADLGEQDVYCITVDHPDHLFVANGFIVANCGKTFTGAMETSYHLTGRYPEWWEGHKFEHPIDAWAASNTTQSTRDALQYTYLGDINLNELNTSGGRLAYGCGTIPKDCIIEYSRARGGANDAVDIVKIRHVSGGVSTLGFKTYEQGRAKFQGTAKHWIHLDEEPPQEIYNECAMRLAGSHINGRLILTMTPLLGMTDVCLKFLQDESGAFHYTQMGWQDALHLSDEEKKNLLAGMLPHEVEAREKGIPAVGSGRVYLTPESDFVVDPFKIPDTWRFVYGLDFGWKNTAAVYAAIDPDTDTVYIYDCYKQGEKEPYYHSSVLKKKGATWMPGVCDPAGQSSSQRDGENLIEIYASDGLNLTKADNSVDAGIMLVYQRLTSGRLKVFSTCQPLLAEYRLYARDEKGKIIKKNDHLLDATRYVIMSGLDIAKQKPMEKRGLYNFFSKQTLTSGWAL